MNVLLIDDHPMTISGFTECLKNEKFSVFEPTFTHALNCKDGYDAINKALQSNMHFDLAILDLGLPKYLDKSIHSGTDLGLLIRSTMKHCKIIMMTAHTETVIIYDTLRKVSPEGFFIKNDITPTTLLEGVKAVVSGEKYQSPNVLVCIDQIWKKRLMVEDINRQILIYMSKGFRTKELEKFLNITASAIQKRVIKMKVVFDAADDDSLVKAAKNQGFI
jgi:DNA-binding NarL/FixJ family response regulator